MSLYDQWMEAKAAEAKAVANRREIEDQLIKQVEWQRGFEGTRTIKDDGYEMKIVGRINRKVDSGKLQEIAAEHGLMDHLSSLFRWKPEINMSAWKATDKSITDPLLDAITAEDGRPSFSIVKKGN